MAYVVLAICALIVALGALGVASPARLFRLLRRYETPGGLYFSAAVRLVLGVALFLVAPTSKAPDLVLVIGIITVAAAVTAPLLGIERIGRLVDWWSARSSIALRAWAAFALAFGLFLVWAVVPRSSV